MPEHSSIELTPAYDSPYVLSCEHAGRLTPQSWSTSPQEREILEVHWGWDIGAAALTRELARRLQAPAILGRWSRLYCDLNRPPDHPELFRQSAEGLDLRFNQGLSEREKARRLERVYHPFHDTLSAMMQAGSPKLLLSVHSFTPVYKGPCGIERRELEVGVLYDDHVPLAQHLLCSLRSSQLLCEANEPYSGYAGQIHSPRLHGRSAGVPYLELELRQDILKDPAGMERVCSALACAVRALPLDESGSQ